MSGHGPKESKMRNNLLIGISSVVAAVAVAGSAMAGVVVDSNPGAWNLSNDASTSRSYTFATAVDMTNSAHSTFRISGAGTASGGGIHTYWLPEEGFDLYDYGPDGEETYVGYVVTQEAGWYTSEREAYRFGIRLYNDAQGTMPGPYYVEFQYQGYGPRNLGDISFNLADIAAMTNGREQRNRTPGELQSTAYSLAWAWYDPATNTVRGDEDFDFSNITRMDVWAGTWGSAGEGVDGGNLSYNALSYSFVPAPGAAALLGAAGLVGGRRRKV